MAFFYLCVRVVHGSPKNLNLIRMSLRSTWKLVKRLTPIHTNTHIHSQKNTRKNKWPNLTTQFVEKMNFFLKFPRKCTVGFFIRRVFPFHLSAPWSYVAICIVLGYIFDYNILLVFFLCSCIKIIIFIECILLFLPTAFAALFDVSVRYNIHHTSD